MWRYRINPNQIEFEITEEELFGKAELAKDSLRLLRKFGFRTAIDDFGSGYSSLGHLKEFEFDTLKLDRTFVTSENYNSSASKGVIGSIVSLADSLNMDIVAEGIETQEQLDFIISLNINIIQGYFCSKPIPANDFIKNYKV